MEATADFLMATCQKMDKWVRGVALPLALKKLDFDGAEHSSMDQCIPNFLHRLPCFLTHKQ